MPPRAVNRILLCGLLAAAGCGSSGAKSDRGDGAADGPRDATAGDAPGMELAGAEAAETAPTEAAPTEVGADVPAEVGTDAPAGGDAVADSGPADVAIGDVYDGPAAEAVPLSKRYHAIAIALGSLHSCALLDDHRVKCWGTGEFGQLGLGDRRNRGAVASEMGNALPTIDLGTGRTAKAITAGRYATCALLDDDSVKCWGLGLLTGQADAGAGTPNIGDEPNEMGDHLAPLPVGAGRKAIAVGLSYYTGCFARDDRTFHCWNTSAQDGDIPAPTDGTKVVRLFNGRTVLALFDDGSLHEISGSIGGPLLFRDAGMVTAAGGSSSGGCALVAGGPPTCWGGSTTAKVSAIPAELVGGRALAFGEFNQACGLTAGGAVKCWGNNTSSAAVSAVAAAIGAPASALASGNGHLCALTEAGDVKCWDFDVPANPAVGGAVHTSTRWDSVDLGDRP